MYLSWVRLLSPLLLLQASGCHRRPDDFHRTVCSRSHRDRHAAEQEPFHAAEPTRPHEKTIRFPVFGLVEEDMLRITFSDHR